MMNLIETAKFASENKNFVAQVTAIISVQSVIVFRLGHKHGVLAEKIRMNNTPDA